jgi:hypothetical protein
MKPQLRIAIAAALCFSGAGPTSARQAPAAGPAGQIPECVKYEAMVNACLPKMCGEERALAEMELSFHRETLAKVVELKGRQEGVQACTRSIRDAIAEDLYGCYTAAAGAARPSIRLDRLQPAATSVAMTLSIAGLAANESARLVIAQSIADQPTAVYALPPEKATFVLDTASAAPAAGGAKGAPVGLDPDTEYCFAIETTKGSGHEVQRKGVFTTRPKR